jgi:hypothetical protein
MPRRYFSYGENSGWWFWNTVSTIGAYLLGASILLFVYNIARGLQSKEKAGSNPWDAPTLEWATSSPPPVYNFAVIPTIEHRDPMWAEKYGIEEHDTQVDVTVAGKDVGTGHVPNEDPGEQALAAMAAQDDGTADVHMPNPSYYPIIAAAGFTLIAIGMLFDNPDIPIGALPMPIVTLFGLLTLIGGIYGWALEPPSDTD